MESPKNHEIKCQRGAYPSNQSPQFQFNGRRTDDENKKCQRRKRSAEESAAASFDIFDRPAGDPPEMPVEEEERDHEILVKRCMIMKAVDITI